MAKLLLVRHGETEMGRLRLLCGRTDEPLNTRGLRQAEQLRDRLTGLRPGAIYSSTLQRARLIAQTLAASLHLQAIPCPEMREMDFGQCEGLTFAQVERLYPEVARLWLSRSPELSYPGGEILEQFRRRIEGFLPRLQEYGAEDTVLLVAHLGSLRLLLCQLLGIPWQHWWQFQLDYTSLSIVETQPRGTNPADGWRGMLLGLNDTSHLDKGGLPSP